MKRWPVIILVIFLMGGLAAGSQVVITGTDSISVMLHDYLPLFLAAIGLMVILVVIFT